MLPVYSALHFIPMLVLRRKSFVRDPIKMLGKAMLGTFRSSSFLAVFIMIYQGNAIDSQVMDALMLIHVRL